MAARVGVVAAWFDPDDPSVWSGVAHGIVGELRRLGVFAGWRDVTPWAPGARVLHRWTGATRRSEAWTLRPRDARPEHADDGGEEATDTGRRRRLGALRRRVRRRRPHPVRHGVRHVSGPARGGRAHAGRVVRLPRRQQAAAGLGRDAAGPGGTPAAYACCVPSRWAADSLVRDHGIAAERVHVVGYARNAEIDGSPERDWSTPRFLFVGRDWHRKNGAAVVRAFERLRSAVPSARLDLVGDHPDVDVEGVVGHGPIGVHEPCGKAALEALFAAATCFVVPSLLEPFGIVYVEAATAGVPSIAGIHGGTADSVGDGGVLVDPTDDDALVRRDAPARRPRRGTGPGGGGAGTRRPVHVAEGGPAGAALARPRRAGRRRAGGASCEATLAEAAVQGAPASAALGAAAAGAASGGSRRGCRGRCGAGCAAPTPRASSRSWRRGRHVRCRSCRSDRTTGSPTTRCTP